MRDLKKGRLIKKKALFNYYPQLLTRMPASHPQRGPLYVWDTGYTNWDSKSTPISTLITQISFAKQI